MRGAIGLVFLAAGTFVYVWALSCLVRKKREARASAAIDREDCPDYEVVLPSGLHFCYTLGVLERNGWAVTGRDAKTIECYLKAAEQGQPEAQRRLGVHFVSGNGFPRTSVRAGGSLNRAAHAGDAVATSVREDLARRMAREKLARA